MHILNKDVWKRQKHYNKPASDVVPSMTMQREAAIIDGVEHELLSIKEDTLKAFEGLKASDFDITSIIANGTAQGLQPVFLSNGSLEDIDKLTDGMANLSGKLKNVQAAEAAAAAAAVEVPSTPGESNVES